MKNKLYFVVSYNLVNSKIMKFTLNIFKDFICFLGANIETDFHQHFETTLVLSQKQKFSIITPDSNYSSTFCILPPNYYHILDASKVDDLIIIYIEPESKYAYLLNPSTNCASTIKLEKNYSIEQTFLNKDNEFDISKVVRFLDVHSSKKIASPIDTRISTIFQYAKNHHQKNLNSKVLAKQVHLSESRFRHLFKKEVGISISKYLQWLRLREVGALIINGKDLSRASGYADFYDAPHFSRTFKEMFGIPPSKVLK